MTNLVLRIAHMFSTYIHPYKIKVTMVYSSLQSYYVYHITLCQSCTAYNPNFKQIISAGPSWFRYR